MILKFIRCIVRIPLVIWLLAILVYNIKINFLTMFPIIIFILIDLLIYVFERVTDES